MTRREAEKIVSGIEPTKDYQGNYARFSYWALADGTRIVFEDYRGVVNRTYVRRIFFAPGRVEWFTYREC